MRLPQLRANEHRTVLRLLAQTSPALAKSNQPIKDYRILRNAKCRSLYKIFLVNTLLLKETPAKELMNR
jgi:hypothetical protein